MKPRDAVPAAVYERIIGYEKLTGLFGYWPEFHDAEILRLLLDRSGRDRSEGPVLTMAVHTFAWGQHAEDGSTIFIHHCTAELRFTQVEDLHLADFNFQNVILYLDFALDEGDTPPRLAVSFPAASGVGGHFTCAGVEVASLTLGIPPGSIYEK